LAEGNSISSFNPAESPEGEAPKSPAADFVSQVRLVHFALVVTCIGIVITAIQEPEVGLSEALRDLDDIIAVTASWSPP
jgi:hypothetical protein